MRNFLPDLYTYWGAALHFQFDWGNIVEPYSCCDLKRSPLNKPTVIGIIILAGFGLAFYNQQRSAGFLEYVVKNVGLSFPGATPILNVEIGIQNPSNTSFVVSAIAGTLYANGEPLSNISSFAEVNIPAKTQAIYPLDFRLSLLGIVSDIVKIFSSGGIAQQLEFKGTVNANGAAFPINLKFQIG